MRCCKVRHSRDRIVPKRAGCVRSACAQQEGPGSSSLSFLHATSILRHHRPHFINPTAFEISRRARSPQLAAAAPFAMASTTSATQKVLSICELLELVISQVPPQHIRKLKPVSKLWCHMIEGSQAIKRSRVLHPERSDEEAWANDDLERFKDQERQEYAILMVHIRLWGCPAVSFQPEPELHVKPVFEVVKDICGVHILLPDSLSDMTAANLEEYVTAPPISAITLVAEDLDGPSHLLRVKSYNQASVFRQGGVNVRDLVDVKDDLQTSQQRLDLADPIWGGRVVARLFVK
ncbi:hypothetical protein CLAFUR4_02311 [Fulvia fulva]|nr:hypothetical protein CLAFUR4_02311 [Fulvia fulva]WPV23264.1 hypothetical protein CLAFUW7_02316 [Fulvia fulva]